MKHATVRAASLVEVLLALTITGLLATGVFALIGEALHRFSAVSGRIAVETAADLVFRQIESDLQTMVLRLDGGVWLAATRQVEPQTGRGDAAVSDAEWSVRAKPTEGSLNFAGSVASELRFGQAGQWLRFFSQIPDTGDRLSNLSAPRAISYQIVRRRLVASATTPSGTRAPMTYLLYRGTARPAGPDWNDTDSSFAAGYDLFASHYARPDAARIDNVGNVRSPRRFEQVLATDVVDFGVRVWSTDSEGRERIVFPVPGFGGFAATRHDGQEGRPLAVPLDDRAEVAAASLPLVYGMPVRVDVVLRILTPAGVRGLRTLEASPAADHERRWWLLVERESQVFVRAFRLPAAVP
jgi:hypothetical protein